MSRGKVADGEELVLLPLSYELAAALAPKVRLADIVDCVTHGSDTLTALTVAVSAGPATALLSKRTGEVIGACGWTFEGAIWSLWADLTPAQSRELMRHAPAAIRAMVKMAAATGVCPLHNVVWEGNRSVLTWLHATKCFDIHHHQRLRVEGDSKLYIPFAAKPLGDLQHV